MSSKKNELRAEYPAGLIRSGVRGKYAESLVLVVDVGGTHVKVRLSSERRVRKIASGKKMTAKRMVAAVRQLSGDARYDVVSIGYPGVVVAGKPVHEPFNLGGGWVGFNFARAFGRPTIVVNDAAMQAWGSYRGGRMLFLGLGTGLGTALIVDGVLEPMELAHLPYRKGRTYEDYAGEAGLERMGKEKWRKHVLRIIATLKAALEVDDVVIGGGNARHIPSLPDGVRCGTNANAFVGGIRLWRARPARGATPVAVARRAP
jgi:polyphosphate glucokinase